VAEWKDAPEGSPKPRSVVAVEKSPRSKKGLVGFEKGKDPLHVGDKAPGGQQVTAIGEKSVDLYPEIPPGDWQGPQQSERVYMEGYAPKGSPQAIAAERNRVAAAQMAKHRRELTDEWGTVMGDPDKGALMSDLEYSVQAAGDRAGWEPQTASATMDAADSVGKQLGLDPQTLTLKSTSEEHTEGRPHRFLFILPGGRVVEHVGPEGSDSKVGRTFGTDGQALRENEQFRETPDWGSQGHLNTIAGDMAALQQTVQERVADNSKFWWED